MSGEGGAGPLAPVGPSAPVGEGRDWLIPRADPQRRGAVPGDYRCFEDVVRIGYPLRAARAYLSRHVGNSIGYKLVEAGRGEAVGQVREIEVLPKGGGDVIRIRTVRTLPDGSPASFYAPEEMVELRTIVEVADGGAVPPLRTSDRVVLLVPVRSYLRFLPGIYRGAVPTQRRDVTAIAERSARQWGERAVARTSAVTAQSTDQFRRFLFLFQHLMTTVTDQIDQIPSLTDPLTADPKFLPWIASWVSFELDGSLPLHQQRELVRRSIRLYRSRGTREGLREMIRVLTAAEVGVVERKRPKAAALGAMTLAGGRNIEERYRRGEPPPCYIVRTDRVSTSFFSVTLEDHDRFKARFGERAEGVLRRISQIVTNEKPAHVTFTIEFEERVK